jgi:hypothetical protein
MTQLAAPTNEVEEPTSVDINTDLSTIEPQQTVIQEKVPLWLYITNALALLVAAVFALRFWQTKRELSAIYATERDELNELNQKETEAWNNFKRTLADKKLTGLRKALINWAQVYWKNASITSLQAIAAQTQDSALADELRKLDEAIFSAHNSAPDTEVLLQLLANLRKTKHKKTADNNKLQPLYRV